MTHQFFDAAKQLTALLIRAGHPRPSEWETITHISHEKLIRSPVEEQMIVINRAFNQYLGGLPGDTMSARSAILHNLDFNDWLLVYKNNVIPEFIHLCR